MPNHVNNIVTLKGDEKKIHEMFAAISSNEYGLGTIDFNKIIPMPKSLDIEKSSKTDTGFALYKEFIYEHLLVGKVTDISKISAETLAAAERQFLQQQSDARPDMWELGKTAWNNIQKYGVPTWYEWRNCNWGTKWNAYGYDDVDYSQNTDLRFLTAWSAPHPILQKLSAMYPDIIFEHEWADEDIGANCGRKIYRNGEFTKGYYPKKGSKEAVEFACRIWDYDPDEFLED